MSLPIDLRSEAAFWHRQFVEHALLTASAMPDKDQKSIADALGRLASQYRDFVSVERTVQLTQGLMTVHEAILQSFAPPRWPGFLSPAVIRHMLLEENWLLGLVSQRWTPGELLFFATKEKSQAAGQLARGLDPSAASEAQIAQKYALKLESLSHVNSFLFGPTVADAVALIGEYVRFSTGRGVEDAEKSISRAMLDHEAREGLHNIETLRRVMMESQR